MDLTQYLKRVLKWWWLVLLSVGIAGVASYLTTSKQPFIYQTTTTLLVGQVTQKVNPTYQDFAMTEQLARSYSQIATRQPVLQAAIDALGLEMDWQTLYAHLSVYPIEGTQLLAITTWDTSPERAVAMADEVAYQLTLQSPTSPENQIRQERGQFIQAQLDDLQNRIQGANTRIDELRTELDTTFSARQIQELQTEIASLENLINTWQANYTDLLSFFEGGDKTNLLTIIETAPLPVEPISPNVQTNVILAALAGLILSIGAVLLVEYIDDTVKSTDNLDELIDVSVLGSVARVKGVNKDTTSLVTAQNPLSEVSEAYRLICTNLQFMLVDQPSKSVVLTSATANEGKSFTVANLAVSLAQANLKTIVVDADLRRPTQHNIFQLPNIDGLTDLLRSPQAEVATYLKSTNINNLSVLPSGPLPPNPAELLSSQRMAQLLKKLEATADIVIFDTPPVMAVTDALVFAGQVGQAIVVVKAGQTRRQMLNQTLDRLRRVKVRIAGVILNQASQRSGSYSSYTYQTYNTVQETSLSTDTAEKERRRWLPAVK